MHWGMPQLHKRAALRGERKAAGLRDLSLFAALKRAAVALGVRLE